MQGLTWRRAGLVLAFCALYAAPRRDAAAVGELWKTYLPGFAVTCAYFLPAFVAVTVAASFAPARLIPRALVLGLTASIGVFIGHSLVPSVRALFAGLPAIPPHIGSLLPLVAIGWLGVAIMLLLEREEEAALALHQAEEHALDLERRMSEARLQVLQSQIEPHFLFNSLAHIRRLCQTDPRAGRGMTRHLCGYLGAAQRALEQTTITLDNELELVDAYLGVQAIRMRPRLTFEIDAPRDARQVPVPPMMITTLVENSIKHGLSPLPEGGMVRVVARVADRTLSIQVCDTGQGFQLSLGSGVGLANIRARLEMLYGPAARLSLHENSPRGVTALVVLPIGSRTAAA